MLFTMRSIIIVFFYTILDYKILKFKYLIDNIIIKEIFDLEKKLDKQHAAESSSNVDFKKKKKKKKN